MVDKASETIDEKVDRVEVIIRTLQEEYLSLGKAKDLRVEGRKLLEALENDLDIGDAEILET
jgi:hypothetical protein